MFLIIIDLGGGGIYKAFPAEWKNNFMLCFQGRNDIPASLPDEKVESSDTKSSKKIYWDNMGATAL